MCPCRYSRFRQAIQPDQCQATDEFATLDQLAAMSLEHLAAWLEQQGRGSFADLERTAQKLHQIARDSYQLPALLAESVDLALRLNLQHNVK
jgi:hypothetical protein